MSVTKKTLSERDAQLDAEGESSGQPSIWRSVYNLMRCPAPSCHLGPHCWQDPSGKKHYKFRTHHLRRLITHVEKGGALGTHKDFPNVIRQELYMEKQQRLEKEQQKGGLGTGVPYLPININFLPSHSPASGLDLLSEKGAIDPATKKQVTHCLGIPGLRDVAVKEHSEWQELNVTDDMLKTGFRQACNIALGNGLDLEQVYNDQDPGFFVGKGIKIGIARRFVDDIGDWVKHVKKKKNTAHSRSNIRLTGMA